VNRNQYELIFPAQIRNMVELSERSRPHDR